MKLNGTVAVVTGASGRLGSVIARTLAKEGCRCICHYNRNRLAAAELVGELEQAGRQAAAVGADLTDSVQIEYLFNKAEELGKVRVLVNSAAIFCRERLADVVFEKAREILDLNLTAAIMTSQIFARRLDRDRKGEVVGKIINIADVGGIRPWADYVVYCASKAGLIGATKAMAKELAPQVCVNAVAPGVVSPPQGLDEPDEKRQLSFIPAGRFGSGEDVAAAVMFLLKNDYVTGQVLCVDGGRTI